MQSGGSRNPDSKGVREWGRREERKEDGRTARRKRDRLFRMFNFLATGGMSSFYEDEEERFRHK